MIKEIALRKLASDEGINPYGVGALGVGGLTGFLVSPLSDNIQEKAENLIRKKYLPKINSNINILKENYDGLSAISKDVDLYLDEARKDYRKVTDDLLSGKGSKYSTETSKRILDKWQSKSSELNAKKIKTHDKIRKLRNMRLKLRTRFLNGVRLPAVGLSALATLGLGGKYLYDKLTD